MRPKNCNQLCLLVDQNRGGMKDRSFDYHTAAADSFHDDNQDRFRCPHAFEAATHSAIESHTLRMDVRLIDTSYSDRSCLHAFVREEVV